jgi:mannose-6-phosphate isomerase-like protein (cupin superfamily)
MATNARVERAQPLWFIDNLAHVHVDEETSGGQFALVELRGARGDMPPLHVHHREDETFYVIEGEVSMFVADDQRILGSGQAALAPRDVPHTYRVESEEARWLVLTTPGGFASFVREVAEPAPAEELPPAGRQDPDALVRAAAKIGIQALGPPGSTREQSVGARSSDS